MRAGRTSTPRGARTATHNDAVLANVHVGANLRGADDGALLNQHRLANVHGDKVEGRRAAAEGREAVGGGTGRGAAPARSAGDSAEAETHRLGNCFQGGRMTAPSLRMHCLRVGWGWGQVLERERERERESLCVRMCNEVCVCVSRDGGWMFIGMYIGMCMCVCVCVCVCVSRRARTFRRGCLRGRHE